MENLSRHKIANKPEDLQLSAEGLGKIEVSGKELCTALYKGELFVCVTKCPHAGGDLTEGYIDTYGNIVCPSHGYKFSLRSGRNITGEGYFLKTFGVEKTAEGVFLIGI